MPIRKVSSKATSKVTGTAAAAAAAADATTGATTGKKSLLQRLAKSAGSPVVFAIIVIGLGVLPLLYSSGAIDSTAMIIFSGKCIALAILAIGIDLIWGYTGMLSLGQGLFFALGGYCMAMHLKMVATGGNITEFMHTGGLSELPIIWRPFLTFPATLVLIIVVPAVVGGLVGFFIFRNRVKGVFFSIISQALTWAAFSLFMATSPWTNGNTGITEIKSVFGSIRGDANLDHLYMLFYVSLGVLVLVFILATLLTRTKFGKLLIAIRDGENRTYFSGYSVSRYKNTIYVISAVLAGIGGALFVNFNGSISPSVMTISYSIMMVVWVAIGGRGTIIGAVIGTLLINFGEYTIASGSMIQAWQFIVGGIFVVVILFFKGGIVGIFTSQLPAAWRWLQARLGGRGQGKGADQGAGGQLAASQAGSGADAEVG